MAISDFVFKLHTNKQGPITWKACVYQWDLLFPGAEHRILKKNEEGEKKQLLPLESETQNQKSEAISQWNSRNNGIITIAFDITCQSTKKKKMDLI